MTAHMGGYSLDELSAVVNEDDRRHRSTVDVTAGCDCKVHYVDERWRGWQLCPTAPASLDYGSYQVDLSEITDSAEALDCIYQVGLKTWTKDGAHLLGFFRALDDILDPQANLCSFGTDRQVTAEWVTARIAHVIERWPLS